MLSSLAEGLGGEHGYEFEIEVGAVVPVVFGFVAELQIDDAQCAFLLATMAVLAGSWSAVSRADAW